MTRVAVLTSLLAVAALTAEQKKVVVVGLNVAAVEQLRAAAPQVKIVPATPDGVAAELRDADGLLGPVAPATVLREGKKLKWMQLYSAGVENFLTPEMKSSPLTLTNCKIIQGPNIADHAMALLLSLTRELHKAIPNRAREDWTREQYHPLELRGKTAVVIGVGGIGTQIAERAHAFGMRIIGVDPKDIPYLPSVSRMVTPDRLDSVLPEADVVFVSAPHTPMSERMMGPRQFELMKPKSYFIAVSRGKLYDTGALVSALDRKHLAGAGLDVTDPEPLPKGHPLWKFENVVITPHYAGSSDHVQARRMELLKENLRRFGAGEPLLNVVDKQKGY